MAKLAALALAAGAAASDLHTPAVLWNLPSAAPATSHFGEVSGPDLERVASSLFGEKKREVHLVFVADDFGTEAVRDQAHRLPTLDALLQKTHSLTLPFTTAHHGDIFGSALRVPIAEAEDFFKDNAHMFSNGKPDTVVVQLPAKPLNELDAAVSRVVEAVEAGAKGNYAGLLTSSRAPHRRVLAYKGVAGAPFLHTTPTLLTAQLVMLILIMIFLGGFCCLFSLQTPKRFEEVKQA